VFDNDLVRAWKDPDGRGDAAHPAGDISLGNMAGGVETVNPLVDWLVSWLVACDGRTDPR
jgi:hypothetical protein